MWYFSTIAAASRYKDIYSDPGIQYSDDVTVRKENQPH